MIEFINGELVLKDDGHKPYIEVQYVGTVGELMQTANKKNTNHLFNDHSVIGINERMVND